MYVQTVSRRLYNWYDMNSVTECLTNFQSSLSVAVCYVLPLLLLPLNIEHRTTIEHVYRLFAYYCSYPTEYFCFLFSVFCFMNRWICSYPFGRVDFSCCFSSKISLFSLFFFFFLLIKKSTKCFDGRQLLKFNFPEFNL